MGYKKMSEFNRANNANSFNRSIEYDQGLRSYMLKVYNYMALALAFTGIVAFAVSSSPALMQQIFGTPLKWVAIFAPLGIVMFISFKVHKMSFSAAQGWLWVYAATMGISMSIIFAVFSSGDIARAFFITAGTFASLSLFGYTTKKDLSGMGKFLFMGVIGLIIASVVNIFLGSSALQFAVSIVSVLIFSGLTVYDTQRLKQNYYMLAQDSESIGKAAVIGALSLYINFIALFQSMLSFVGMAND